MLQIAYERKHPKTRKGHSLIMQLKDENNLGEIEIRWLSNDVTLLRKLVAEGRQTSEIAAILGVKPQRVQDKRINLGIGPRAYKGGVKRDCLVCGEEFSSRGAHNRLCTRCRTKDFWPW